ncbi:sugar transferase [Winogradskyella sediminis]|uniref:sugar transferase n=1 Tax=Winogradskyella sediminis TaxID=1382466 RepID=UPI000E2542DB|nr:sugar transferase [Winogradskyella sediminis]REG87705.1 lipopolysaccharide/colanic/teichoic acid biosynthesis glycosyltransferase [Winogradskyella sediminis]
MISKSQLRFKRIFDVVLVVLCLPLLFIPILLLVLIATIDTKTWGIYSQLRVGQYGKLFKIYKIRTLADGEHQLGGLINHATCIGRFLRRSKLNELPQLYNVFIGDMSLVGPRPDLPGFADTLNGKNRIILMVKPGITGPASIKYRDEEALLAQQKDPEHYNRAIIWVDKVKINKKYVENYSFYLDLTLILKSLIHK